MKATVYSTYAECFGDLVDFHNNLVKLTDGIGLCPNVEYKPNGDIYIDFPVSELNYNVITTQKVIDSIAKLTDGSGTMMRHLVVEHYEFAEGKYPHFVLNVKWLRDNARLVRKEERLDNKSVFCYNVFNA